jgi:hypothetical protein
MKITRLFIYSAAIVLLLAGLAKVISATGHGKILLQVDPLTGFKFRDLFYIAGGTEIIISLICVISWRIWISAALVAWLATSFLTYRIGLVLIGYHKPCSCLGSFTDAVHIPPQIADMTMKIVLLYLLIGSYGILLWSWRQNQRPSLRLSERFF